MKPKAQIISFPKAKTARVLSYQKSESRQILGALSLVSLVLVAIFANDQLTKTQRPIYIVSDNQSGTSISELNRAIASSRPMNPLRDLEWEHKLAKKLGHATDEERAPASFGRQVSGLDQIRFGVLAGKYRVSADASDKLKEIDYVASLEADEHPQYIDRESFLRKYRESMPLAYHTFEFKGINGTTEVYSLKDSGDQVLGLAQFTLDDQGRFLSFKLSQK
jgi:hypothetical protein